MQGLLRLPARCLESQCRLGTGACAAAAW